ncbi:protein of unknown function [Ralstonia solanacearum CMR15]|nr:protein of unknown function [Ralstonia solanacearum CMR15]
MMGYSAVAMEFQMFPTAVLTVLP